MIIDTGSDWLIVEGADCPKCNGNVYDPATSSYFEEVSYRKETKEYGSFIHIEGKEVKDLVCLGKNQLCIDPFKFFLLSDQFGIPEDADGILGLAQGESPFHNTDVPINYNVGALLIDDLRLLGHISQKSFSTRFEGRDASSYL